MLKLKISDDLGVTYRDDLERDDLEVLVKSGQFLAGDSKVDVRWVVVDERDQVVAQCDVMTEQLKTLNASDEPSKMITDDNYMKQLVKRFTKAEPLSTMEFIRFVQNLQEGSPGDFEKFKGLPLDELVKGLRGGT